MPVRTRSHTFSRPTIDIGMKYYLYQITNKVNGKIYVGVHKSKSLDDGYMGSGKVIKAAIEKHGAENFHKEILELFESSGEMYEREKEIVNEEFLARDDVYNLRLGGRGGFDHINASGQNGSKKRAILQLDPEWVNLRNSRVREGLERKHKEDPDLRRRIREGQRRAGINFGDLFRGKTHSKETKQILSQKAKISSKGERNSQYGTYWITDGDRNRKMKPGQEIPSGWYRGRTLSK